MIKLKTTVLAFMLGAFATGISAQSFNGMHKYDGEHKNELNAYLVGGNNVVVDWFGGAAVSYKRHITDRWHVGADAQAQLGKQLYSVDIQGGYRLPYKWMDFYIDGKAMYNRYHKWHTNETAFNLSVTWETPISTFVLASRSLPIICLMPVIPNLSLSLLNWRKHSSAMESVEHRTLLP